MCPEQQSVASPLDGENKEDSLLLPVTWKVSQESPFPGLHCGFAHLVSVSKVNSPYKLTNLKWEFPPCCRFRNSLLDTSWGMVFLHSANDIIGVK